MNFKVSKNIVMIWIDGKTNIENSKNSTIQSFKSAETPIFAPNLLQNIFPGGGIVRIFLYLLQNTPLVAVSSATVGKI